jgi:Holliday junction resolvase RusA-like endonuclease
MDRIKKEIKQQLPKGFKYIEKEIPVTVNCIFFCQPAKYERTKKFLEKIQHEDIPYLKKPDRDNADKFALDIMSKIVFYDDNQVYDGRLTKYYSINPRTEIEVIWT